MFGALLLLAACGKAPQNSEAALESPAIELPADTDALPPGADVGMIEAKCTACHSLDMITTQPKMPAEKWAGIVKKMREVYGAPIAPAEDAQFARALAQMQETGAR